MLFALRSARYPVELGILVALCLFLPLIEAPKNLAWLLYVATWLVNRVRDGDFGARWDGWDTLFAAWIASGFVVAAFAGLQQSEWKGAGDLLRYGSLAWLVRRAGYGRAEVRLVIGALVASTVAGLAFGWYQLLVSGKRGTLQLHSVGHVNHTAIYLAIMLGVCAAWCFARWQAWTWRPRIVGGAILALLLGSLVATQSRGAVGVGLVLVPLLAAAWWPRWRVPLVASVGLIALTVAIAIATDAGVVRKQQQRWKESIVFAYRDGVWASAIAAWEKFPLFGVGMDNYSGITPERIRQWRQDVGKHYVAEDYIRFPHGHSLLFNTLAERGLVGTAALAAVLLAWLGALWRRYPRASGDDQAWLRWGAAAAAWIGTVGIGTVNTTLHHEHGMLAALLLAVWLGPRRA